MLTFDSFIISLNEGLIKTVELDKAISIIERSLIGVDIFHRIEKNNDNKTFNLTFENNVPINVIDGLFNIINNMGYFCSYCTYFKKIGGKNLPWVDIMDYIDKSKSCTGIKFYFESKFDETLKHKPSELYHVCNEVNIHKIKKIGLIPKSKSKRTNHPDRIYVTLHLSNAQKMMNNFIFDDRIKGLNNTYHIIKIDITDKYYDNIRLFKDPNYQGGYYTYQNFRPKDLNLL